MKERNRNLGCWLILALIIVCLSVPLIIYRVTPKEPDIICTNLLEAEQLDSKNDCIKSDWPLDYAPHYFPVGKTTTDDVKTGMQGFELLRSFTNSSCEQDRKFTLLKYGLRPIGSIYTEEITFFFCDDILNDISYHN